MYERILVAYDGSDGALAALKQGIAVAHALGRIMGSMAQSIVRLSPCPVLPAK